MGAGLSHCFNRDVFEWRGVDKARDQTKARLPDARSDPVDKGELPDRREDRLLINELLNFFEHCSTLLMVELAGLFGEQIVDIGITAVSIGATLDDKGGEAGRRIAKGAT